MTQDYAPLTDGEAEVPQASAYAYYIIPKEPKKRKQFGCGFCLVTLTLFLVGFILIPRAPFVYLDHLEISTENQSLGGELYGKFGFDNTNFYAVDWSNPAVNLYWLPHDEQLIVQSCHKSDTANAACAFYYRGMCAIPVGDFIGEDKAFTTDARSASERDLKLEQSPQEMACALNMLASYAKNGKQMLLSKGHVRAKADIVDFGKVGVSDTYYYMG